MATKSITTNYLVAQASALVLDPATTDELTVRGLTGLTLPLGFEMSNVTVSEMGRRIDLVVPSGGTYTPLDITANFVPGDASQAIFQDAALNSTKLTAMRFYLKAGCDFAALDLINDTGGGYLIGTYSPPTVASKNELFQNQITILPAGSSVLFVAHTTAGEGAELSYVAATRILTLGTGSFVTMGFEVGDVLYLDYADSNDPLCLEAAAVTSSTITFTDATGDEATLAAGSATWTGGSTCQLHGATAIEVSGSTTTCD